MFLFSPFTFFLFFSFITVVFVHFLLSSFCSSLSAFLPFSFPLFSILSFSLSQCFSFSFFLYLMFPYLFFSIAVFAYPIFVLTHFSALSSVLDLILLFFILLYSFFIHLRICFLPKQIQKFLWSIFWRRNGVFDFWTVFSSVLLFLLSTLFFCFLFILPCFSPCVCSRFVYWLSLSLDMK